MTGRGLESYHTTEASALPLCLSRRKQATIGTKRAMPDLPLNTIISAYLGAFRRRKPPRDVSLPLAPDADLLLQLAAWHLSPTLPGKMFIKVLAIACAFATLAAREVAEARQILTNIYGVVSTVDFFSQLGKS